MCSFLFLFYVEFQLLAIIETLPQMIKKTKINFWFLLHVGPTKSPDIYELYVSSVKVQVAFRDGACLIKRMFTSISSLCLIATRFRFQLSPIVGATTSCAANLKPVPGSCLFWKICPKEYIPLGNNEHNNLYQVSNIYMRDLKTYM